MATWFSKHTILEVVLMFLRVLFDDVTSALNEHPNGLYWESSGQNKCLQPRFIGHIVDKLTFIQFQATSPWRESVHCNDALGFMEEIRKGKSRGLREDSGAGVKILVLRKGCVKLI